MSAVRLIVGITIPFALVTAFILMHLTKISANLLSLGAIDFGIIVDGAIVMTEAVLRRREARPDEPLERSRCRRRRSAGCAADLLCNADHHYRLPTSFRVSARRGKAVLPDDLCGRLCAAWRAAAGADTGSRFGLSGVSQAATRLPQSRRHVARGAVSASAHEARSIDRVSSTS